MATTKPRHNASERKHYLEIADVLKGRVEARAQSSEVGPLSSVPRYCRWTAFALYSAGESVELCRQWFDRAVGYELRLHKLRGYRTETAGDALERFELYASSHFCGRLTELLDSFGRFEYTEKDSPWAQWLSRQLDHVVSGKGFAGDPTARAEMQKRVKGMLPFPLLLEVWASSNTKAFPDALTEYLNKVWLHHVREIIPDGYPVWCGSAAMACARMGFVPDLPSKLMKYLPVKLIDK